MNASNKKYVGQLSDVCLIALSVLTRLPTLARPKPARRQVQPGEIVAPVVEQGGKEFSQSTLPPPISPALVVW